MSMTQGIIILSVVIIVAGIVCRSLGISPQVFLICGIPFVIIFATFLARLK